GTLAPIHGGPSLQDDQSSFFVASVALRILSCNQPAHGKVNRVPLGLFPSYVDHDREFPRGNNVPVNQNLLCVRSSCHGHLLSGTKTLLLAYRSHASDELRWS